MTKDEAIVFLLNFLNSKMSAMSLPTRNKALEVAELHNISASELLKKYIDLVRGS